MRGSPGSFWILDAGFWLLFALHPSPLTLRRPSSHRQLIKPEQPLLAPHELRCKDRSPREAVTAAGAVGDLDEVVGGVEEERVQSELAADARGGDGRLELPAAAGNHLGGDLQRRAARCVLLLRVVAFLEPRRILREAREELTGPAGPRAPP